MSDTPLFLTLIFGLAFPTLLAGQEFTRVENLAGLDELPYSNGVAVADYDQDGDLDLMFVRRQNPSSSNGTTDSHLFMNLGNGSFEDVSEKAGLEFDVMSEDQFGASWGDYDNDGFPDLYLTTWGLDQLYRNLGDGHFENVTEQAGISDCDCHSTSALWWDYDLDGDLDLYVSAYFDPNTMYENQGDGTFEDITTQTGLGDFGLTWTSVALDVGHDGIPDLYVVNDFGENNIYEGHIEKFFKPATNAYGLGDPGHGMGVAIGDYNNDGFFDIYVTNIAAHFLNPLYTYTEDSGYVDRAGKMGVEDTGWGWGTQFFDYDHDGDEDLYAVNGIIAEFEVEGAVQEDRDSYLFKNLLMQGSEGFVDWSMESGTNGQPEAVGIETFDYDEDGDLDIVVANIGEAPYLYRNETVRDGVQQNSNWIKIWLEGSVSNRDALGSTVRVTSGGQSYYRYHHGAGLLGQSLKPVHFGLGAATTIDEIRVTWPTGEEERIRNVSANQTLKLKEGEMESIVTGVEESPSPRSLGVAAYPNPFESFVTFRIGAPAPGTVELRVFSVVGVELFRKSTTAIRPGPLDLEWKYAEPLNPGVYLYRVSFQEQTVNGKLIRSKP